MIQFQEHELEHSEGEEDLKWEDSEDRVDLKNYDEVWKFVEKYQAAARCGALTCFTYQHQCIDYNVQRVSCQE